MENFTICYVDKYFEFFLSYLSKALDSRSYHIDIYRTTAYFYQYSIITWDENLNPDFLNNRAICATKLEICIQLGCVWFM